MHIRKLLVMILLGLSFSAAAEFTTITAAYEVAVSDLRLPGSSTGTLSFKQCAGCAAQTIRVNGQTRYLLDGRALTLSEFKVQLGSLRNRKHDTATVMHHLESNTITAIKVQL